MPPPIPSTTSQPNLVASTAVAAGKKLAFSASPSSSGVANANSVPQTCCSCGLCGNGPTSSTASLALGAEPASTRSPFLVAATSTPPTAASIAEPASPPSSPTAPSNMFANLKPVETLEEANALIKTLQQSGMSSLKPLQNLAPNDVKALNAMLKWAQNGGWFNQQEEPQGILPTQGTLTSPYGWRWGRMHYGIDIQNKVGTPIKAAAPGVVTEAGWSDLGYGYLIAVQHPDGSMTRYAHNEKLLVEKGALVEGGQQLSEMGSTGNSTGSHLHFELLPPGQEPVDPKNYFREPPK